MRLLLITSTESKLTCCLISTGGHKITSVREGERKKKENAEERDG